MYGLIFSIIFLSRGRKLVAEAEVNHLVVLPRSLLSLCSTVPEISINVLCQSTVMFYRNGTKSKSASSLSRM